MTTDGLDEVGDKMLRAAEGFPYLNRASQLLFLREVIEGETETIHHYLHGKKHGPTFRDCDLATCQFTVKIVAGMSGNSA